MWMWMCTSSPNPSEGGELLGLWIWDLEFGIWNLEFGIWDLGFGIWDLGFVSEIEIDIEIDIFLNHGFRLLLIHVPAILPSR